MKNYSYELTPDNIEKGLTILNSTYNKGIQNKRIPFLSINFPISNTKEAIPLIEKKLIIARDNNIPGVGAEYSNTEVIIGIPLKDSIVDTVLVAFAS